MVVVTKNLEPRFKLGSLPGILIVSDPGIISANRVTADNRTFVVICENECLGS